MSHQTPTKPTTVKVKPKPAGAGAFNPRTYAKQMARKYGIPANLFNSMIAHESGWNAKAISKAGAIGYAQLMPGTAEGMGIDPYNPRQNIEGGARYLHNAYKHFGNWKDALRAYNQGWGGAAQSASNGLSYAQAIMDAAGVLQKTPALQLNPTSPAHGLPRLSGNSGLVELAEMLFPDDPSFVEAFRSTVLPPQAKDWEHAGEYTPGKAGGHKVSYRGDALVLPTNWKPTHISDGLDWNNGKKTAIDIMAAAGTPVGAPEAGTVVYFHPNGAQGGGSMLFRTDSGQLYWLGHLDDGVAPGTRVERGGRIAVVSSRHPAPHVHMDRYYGNDPGRWGG